MSRISTKERERILRAGRSLNVSPTKAQGSFAAPSGYPDKMQPELTIKSKQIDLDICGLLGDKPADFLVLCFDGVQLEDFGTPYDSPAARERQQLLCDSLNDKSAESRWPEMWQNWKPNICKQFGLDETTTSDRYRPLVSYKISRVCAGYSEHLHCAIGLFETLADKIEMWMVSKGVDCRVTVIDKHRRTFVNLGNNMPLVIAKTVREMLRANQDNS